MTTFLAFSTGLFGLACLLLACSFSSEAMYSQAAFTLGAMFFCAGVVLVFFAGRWSV